MNKELQITAIHEAGHVIACRELEVLYDNASIVPGEGRDGAVKVEGDDGFFTLPGTDPFSPENERAFQAWAEQQSVIDFAGHAAVVSLLGLGDMSAKSAETFGAGSDYEKAHRRLGGDAGRIGQTQERAVQIVTERQEELRRIATELLERQRLSAQQVDWILYRAEPIPEWLK